MLGFVLGMLTSLASVHLLSFVMHDTTHPRQVTIFFPIHMLHFEVIIKVV